MDEPFGAVDEITLGTTLQDEILRIHHQENTATTILVTHDINEAFPKLGSRVMVIDQGKKKSYN